MTTYNIMYYSVKVHSVSTEQEAIDFILSSSHLSSSLTVEKIETLILDVQSLCLIPESKQDNAPITTYAYLNSEGEPVVCEGNHNDATFHADLAGSSVIVLLQGDRFFKAYEKINGRWECA